MNLFEFDIKKPSYCKTLKFGSSKFWLFLWVDLLTDLYFGGYLISKKKKKSVISDAALWVLCMQALYGDMQVIQDDFQLSADG